MAEVHIIGSIQGACGFPKSELTCKWNVLTGSEWRLVEGEVSGQTHVDIPLDTRFTVWSHPIDIHYATHSLEGWPKLQFQVFRQDIYGRNELYGYGFVHVPASPGFHSIECVTWKPLGSMYEQIWSYFMGTSAQLKNLDLIHTPNERFKLVTQAMGKVYVDVSVVVKNFSEYGVAV